MTKMFDTNILLHSISARRVFYNSLDVIIHMLHCLGFVISDLNH